MQDLLQIQTDQGAAALSIEEVDYISQTREDTALFQCGDHRIFATASMGNLLESLPKDWFINHPDSQIVPDESFLLIVHNPMNEELTVLNMERVVLFRNDRNDHGNYCRVQFKTHYARIRERAEEIIGMMNREVLIEV
jgi:hypothetical protein